MRDFETTMKDADIEKQRKTLYKRLGHGREVGYKLLNFETRQSINDTGVEKPFRNSILEPIKVEVKQDCILFDERDPLSTQVKMRLKLEKSVIDRSNLKVSNLRHKRQMMPFEYWSDLILYRRNYSLVKFVALEGASLTCLGVFSYDAATDQLSVTELAGILSGGPSEAQRNLAECLSSYKHLAWNSFIIGASLGLVSLLIKWIRARKLERNLAI